jgi:hypothetical protein
MDFKTALFEAVQDATEKRNILFLVSNPDVEVSKVVRSARETVLAVLRTKFVNEDVSKFFVPTANDWMLKTSLGGWVLFFPLDIAEAKDDIGSTDFVYWLNKREQYEKISYKEWQKHRLAGHTWKPDKTTAVKKGEKTAWDRLLDDDFEG